MPDRSARRWVAVVALPLSLAWGCSADDGPVAPCESASECVRWRCVCQDGSTPSAQVCLAGRCLDGPSACAAYCSDRVVSAGETPNVNDSPECDAVCARAESIACGDDPGCNRYHYCGLDEGECATEKRAYLRCLADQGSFQCNDLGGVTSSSTGCPSARCTADAG
jgi:hypothetical protein